MKSVRRLIFLTALGLSVLALAGCEISKSTPPPKKEKTGKTAIPSADETEIIDPAKILESYVTQTAQAANAGTQMPNAEGTPISSTEGGGELALTPSENMPAGEATLDPSLGITPLTEYMTEQPALVGTSAITPAAGLQTTAVPLENIPSPTAGPPPQTYTVQKGEFPYCLARRFDVNINDLLSQNNVGGSVDPGQTLKIPQGASPFGGARSLLPHPTTYTVKGGDTIYTIACAFGDVDPVYLAQVNNIPSPYTLSPGQVLQVP